MIAAEIHNGHDCHHQVQSRRVILTTGNETSTHLCLVLPFDPVPKTLKLPRYRPKCAAKNDFTLLLYVARIYNFCTQGFSVVTGIATNTVLQTE